MAEAVGEEPFPYDDDFYYAGFMHTSLSRFSDFGEALAFLAACARIGLRYQERGARGAFSRRLIMTLLFIGGVEKVREGSGEGEGGERALRWV